MIYVGLSTKSPENSIKYLGSGIRLKYAIKKYGKENFHKEILEECTTRDELNDAEMKWISTLNTLDINIGYNLHKGGSCSKKDFKLGKEAIERSKIRNKKLWEDPDYRKKVTDANKKTWSTPEKQAEHSIRMKEVYLNPDTLMKLKDSARKMEKLECPHCKKIYAKNHAISKHFDNCINHEDPEMRELAIKRRNEINKETVKKTCKYCGTVGVVGNINRWHEENCKKKSYLFNCFILLSISCLL